MLIESLVCCSLRLAFNNCKVYRQQCDVHGFEFRLDLKPQDCAQKGHDVHSEMEAFFCWGAGGGGGRLGFRL